MFNIKKMLNMMKMHNMTKILKNIIYFTATWLLVYYIISDKRVYNFEIYDVWKNNINNKQIYVFNEHDYCVKTHTNLLYTYYDCSQNIELKKNDIHTFVSNKNNKASRFIFSTETNLLSVLVYIISFVFTLISMCITLIIVMIIYTFGYITHLYKEILNFFVLMPSFFSNKPINISIEAETGTESKSEIKTEETDKTFDLNTMIENILSPDELIVNENKDNTVTIDNFIGCENIKKDMNKLILQIKYEKIYKTNDCMLPKAVLLLGPPGVGKTHLVKTIINSTGMKYIFMTGSDFNSRYVGSGTAAVSKLFKKARKNKPCLIFIDEADAILKTRHTSDDSAAAVSFNSTICKFLAEMDSLKTESGVIVIFASNMDIEQVDKGLNRSGRIDQIINMTLPTFEERILLFKMYLKNLYDEKLIDLNKVAKLSYGLTGADIKKIVNFIKINKTHNFVDNINKTINEKSTEKSTDETKTDDKSTDEKSTDNKSTDETKTDDKSTDKSTDDKSTDETKTDETKTDDKSTDETKTDDKSIDETKTDETKTDETQTDDKSIDETKTDETKTDEKSTDETKTDIIDIKITTEDIDKEISKCIFGMERERKINELNKKIIAYHEAGHAILGFLIKNSTIPTKICISINSKSLGYTLFSQDDDDLLVKTTITQLLIEVMTLYGGRMSEKIFIGDITCGAEDDYSRARKILKRLLMNGMLILENNYVDYKDKNLKANDEIELQLKSINKIILEEVKNLLETNAVLVHEISAMIIEYGSITSDDVYEIFKTNNMNEKLNSYDINIILTKISNVL